jgi:hypothetical protein
LNIEAIVKAASGALTPLVAVLAVYIAYRQYRVEHHAAKIELFGRRFDIYQRALKYIYSRCQSDAIPHEISRDFRAAVVEANFLFGQDVCGALQEISRRGIDIDVAASMIRSSPVEGEMAHVYKMRDHQQWFVQAEPHLSKVFNKYLKVGWLR